jgi:hypothetical protein
MEEGRKRALGIIAGILIARHPKTTEDFARQPKSTHGVAGSIGCTVGSQ